MSHFQFKKQTTTGPDGTVLTFVNTEENSIIEIATVEGITYVYVPEGTDVPEQPVEISWQSVIIDPILREKIKEASPICQLIQRQLEEKIRERYSLEDEQYYARIGVGVALGKYVFEPGEEQELNEFGIFVEMNRQWGRDRRAEIGL